MSSRSLTKLLALLVCLSVAAPAMGRGNYRCKDGTPCPMTATVTAAASPDQSYTCCPPQPCEHAPLPAPDPAQCVLDTATPLTFIEHRAATDLTRSPVFALAPVPTTTVQTPEPKWVVAPAEDILPASLSPKLRHAPRAPPTGR